MLLILLLKMHLFNAIINAVLNQRRNLYMALKDKTKREIQEYLKDRYKKQNDKIKEDYDRVSVTLPKGTKDIIKAKGESINGYINRLIMQDLNN